MPFRFELLGTDILIWLLIGAVGLFAWYVLRHEHLVAPWKRVGHSRAGMAAATVLAVFVVVGLLDSIHYRPAVSYRDGKAVYSVEVLSLLDRLAQPLRTSREKTYSAPLSAYLFSKEAVELPGGGQAREYPRLKYGGSHLKDPEAERAADISRRALWGFAAAMVAWIALIAMLSAALARHHRIGIQEMWRNIWLERTETAWLPVIATAGALLALAGPVLALAGHYHVFGTDKVGQDVLYLTLKSVRTGLVIGTLTTLIMLPFAVALGTMAGYFKGWVDDLIQYVYTTLASIPGVLLIAAAVLMTQVYMEANAEQFATTAHRADFRLLWLCIILGVASWTGLCRLLRGETLKLRELEYVQAAQAFGVSRLQIITRHIVPNVMHLVLIVVVLDFSGLVLAEAVLAYIGVGVDPSMISFGGMINSARLEMAREPMVWWLLAAAFCFMLLIVLSANLFADAVRDAFDPRVRTKPLTAERLRSLLPAGRPGAAGRPV